MVAPFISGLTITMAERPATSPEQLGSHKAIRNIVTATSNGHIISIARKIKNLLQSLPAALSAT
jgi:hypothetical protein